MPTGSSLQCSWNRREDKLQWENDVSTELENKRVETNQKPKNALRVPAPQKDTEKAHLTSVGERTVRRTADAQLAYESVQE